MKIQLRISVEVSLVEVLLFSKGALNNKKGTVKKMPLLQQQQQK